MKIRIFLVSDSKKMQNLNLLQLEYQTQAFGPFSKGSKIEIATKNSNLRALKSYFIVSS